jgi:hypothetical protein
MLRRPRGRRLCRPGRLYPGHDGLLGVDVPRIIEQVVAFPGLRRNAPHAGHQAVLEKPPKPIHASLSFLVVP